MKKPTRGMRMRWAGMALVALAVVIGTPVAVSFVSLPLALPCPPSSLPGPHVEEERIIHRGGFVWTQVVTPTIELWRPRSRATGSPWRFAWDRTPTRTHVSVPVWPLPVIAAIPGALLWWRGAREIRMNAEAGPRRMTRCIGLAAAFLGLFSASLVATSFAFSGGANGIWFLQSLPPRRLLVWEIERGSAGAWYTRDARNSGLSPFKVTGPLFKLDWTTHPYGWSVCCPIWPVALAFLGLGTLALWRNERALLRACRGGCTKCGYPIDTVPGGVCPECGE